jgi:hypothetical protein
MPHEYTSPAQVYVPRNAKGALKNGAPAPPGVMYRLWSACKALASLKSETFNSTPLAPAPSTAASPALPAPAPTSDRGRTRRPQENTNKLSGLRSRCSSASRAVWCMRARPAMESHIHRPMASGDFADGETVCLM